MTRAVRMRTPPGTSLTVSALLSVAAVGVVVTAVSLTAVDWSRNGASDTGLVLAFVVLIGAGELFRVTLPGDRDAAPVGTALGLALAMLPEVGADPVDYGAAEVVAIVAAGTLIGVTLHVVAGRAPRADVVARRILVVTAAAIAFREIPADGTRPLSEIALDWHDGRWRLAVAAFCVSALALLLDVLLAALVRRAADRGRLSQLLADEARALLGIGAAVSSTGVLVAVATRPMGLLAVPVFAVPLLLAQFAFRRYAIVRATYRQTIRSLSRLTELGGYTEAGHSQRVAGLAVAIGRDLGMSERELLNLEYAALMHDIGQLSLTEPIPGGATVMAPRAEQHRIASLGADIVRQTGVLPAVADILAHQADPYRRAREQHADGDVAVSLGARIVRVSNAYDDLVADSTERGRQLEALDRLHLGLAHEYDPRVVTSLHRVVDRASLR